MTFEGWNWSLIGSVAGLATTLLCAGIPLIYKIVHRKRKPKPTEEEKLQRKHAKTRSNADQKRPTDMAWVPFTARARPPSKPRPRPTPPPPKAVVPLPGGTEIPVHLGSFGLTTVEAVRALENMQYGKSKQAPEEPAGPPNVLIRDGEMPAAMMCDKTVADCERHGNLVRFGGAPHIQGSHCTFVFGSCACIGPPPPLEDINKGALYKSVYAPDYLTK